MNAALSSQVLVVGAGPTGLVAAALLGKLGIRVRIIDKNRERSVHSKALAVHAGTLECLEKVFGKALVDEMIAAGRPVTTASMHLYDRDPGQIDFGTIPSRYNFVLILAQSETERILEAHLAQWNIRVERETALVALREDGNRVTFKIRPATGAFEEHDCDILLGCDGAHSSVRTFLDIPFPGGTYKGEFILGDVTLDWPWSFDSVRILMSDRGVIAAFPLKGDRAYRLILIPRVSSPSLKNKSIDAAEFAALAALLSANRLSIRSSAWLTRFSVHHRIAARFRKGRVFLAGDAAHIHSPAGGQGMNTGIQDALNLGFKVRSALKGALPLRALDAYEAERRPVARRILFGTDIASRVAFLEDNAAKRWIKQTLLPRAIRWKWVQRRMATMLSAVATAREEISRYPVA